MQVQGGGAGSCGGSSSRAKGPPPYLQCNQEQGWLGSGQDHPRVCTDSHLRSRGTFVSRSEGLDDGGRLRVAEDKVCSDQVGWRLALSL